MALTKGAQALQTADTLVNLVRRTGISKSMLASYRSGRVEPSDATRQKIEETIGIARALWSEPAGPGAESDPTAPGEGPDRVSTPREVAAAARAHRVALMAKGAAARDIAAALNAERSALELLAGDVEVYNRLVMLTAATLKEYPEALAAWQAATTEAGL